jgi:hypothetical protein
VAELCFLGRIILGRIILEGVAGALWFLPQKGTRKHKILDGRVHPAGRFLCIFVPLCGYDSAGRWVVNQLPCLGCGFVGMILPLMILPKMRRAGSTVFFAE